MTVDHQTLLAIVGMALVTYALRAGGLWLLGRVTLSGRVEAWFRYVPGTVLISLIAPGVLANGAPGAIAAAATVGVAARTGNALLAMVAGVLTVLITRAALAGHLP
jgi:uncharacterized membrane protein